MDEIQRQLVQFDEVDWPRIKPHCWCVVRGVVRTTYRGKTLLLHRFIMSPKSSEVVVFVTPDRMDFRRANLRVLSRSEYMYRQLHPEAKFVGVEAREGRFHAHLGSRSIGVFDTEAEAAKAVDDFHKKKYGYVVNFKN